MFIDFSKRSQEPEMIDSSESLPHREVVTMLRELCLVNRWLGGTEACLGALGPLVERIVSREGKRRTIRIVDLGSGCADIPAALVCWARGKGYPIHVTAVDSNAAVCQVAQERTSALSEISVVQGDVLHPPLRRGVCDLVFCSALLHHFSDEQVAGILTGFRTTAGEAVVVSDLHRHPLAYIGIRLLTALLSRSAAVRHDGPLSVLKGFRRGDLLAILKKAAIARATVQWRWAFRYLIVIPVRDLPRNLSE